MNYLINLDNSILNFFSITLKNSFFDWLMPILTMINNQGEIWVFIALILILNKNRKIKRAGYAMLLSLAIGYTLGEGILKNLIKRPRPIIGLGNYKFLIKLPGSYSFPSGHTTSSFASFGALYFKKIKNNYLALILAVLISFSRIYLHVHYPSDVLGGIILGLLSARIASLIIKE